tara:strand:+ start:10539 stop:10808 length:270 start_codon:yes stop_codon:yes gene_type:complete
MRAGWSFSLVAGQVDIFTQLLPLQMRYVAVGLMSESYSWELPGVLRHVFYLNWVKNIFSYLFVVWTEGYSGHIGELPPLWLARFWKQLG